MKITLLGALAIIGIAALLIYIGNEWQRTSQPKAVPPPQAPDSPPQTPDPSTQP
jgi:hypothetical protein